MFHEDFPRTRNLVDSRAAARGITVEDTGHGIDCFAALGKEVEKCVFDLDVLLRGRRVCQGREFGEADFCLAFLVAEVASEGRVCLWRGRRHVGSR